MEKKILLIDDEQKILEVLDSYLLKEGYKVFTAETGSRGLEIFYREQPDLVVIDLMLPDMQGEDICREIRKTSSIPVIMLTAKTGESNIVAGLETGADDYITKPFGLKEITARIKAALRRHEGAYSQKAEFNSGKLVIDYLHKTVQIEGIEVILTPAEFRILETMSKLPGRVFTRSDLLNIISGNDFSSFDRTVDVHIKNIRAKIEKDTRNPEYIITVFGTGYKFMV